MKREKELVKNTFIISLGFFLPKLTSFVTLPILTAYLTKTEYGTLDLINTLVSFLLPIITLKIDASAFRFLIEERSNQKNKGEIISTIYFFLFLISIPILIISFLFFRNITPLAKMLICFYFVCDAVYSATLQILRGLSKNVLYSVVAIVSSIINMLLIVFLIYGVRKGLYGLIISTIISQVIAITLAIYISKIYKNISVKNISKSILIKMIKYSWPMIPNTLSFWVMNLSDRLIIASMIGIEANAIYAVANKIPSLFTTIQNVFVTAWQENASLSVKDEDVEKYYSKMFKNVYSLLIGIFAIITGATPYIFSLLINKSYSDAYFQMPILSGAVFFSAIASYIGGIYIAHKRTKSVGITTTISAIINFLINIIFIKLIGIYAASLSTLFSYIFLAIYRIIDIQKIQKLRIDFILCIKYFFLIVLMIIITYINNKYLNILNLVFGVCIFLCTNKNILIVLKNKILEGKKNNEKC